MEVKSETRNGKKLEKALKAYDNKDFIHSNDGRLIRILAEYLHPEQNFKKHSIKSTIIFFGSARIKPLNEIEYELDNLKNSLINADNKVREQIQKKIKELEKKKSVSIYYEEAYKLSKMIVNWSNSLPKHKQFHICTGGGPGIMEAASKGAYDAGGKVIGLNISLPAEQEPNRYISPELNFEFHYFFMRKFWLVYPAKALIIFPGGFGTIDELMEILTLRQTHKMKRPRLILLYSSEFWNKVINFEYLVEMGTISRSDLNLFKVVNSPDEAFDVLKTQLIKNYNI